MGKQSQMNSLKSETGGKKGREEKVRYLMMNKKKNIPH